VPPLAINAQTMRAILLARATITSMGGLRLNMFMSQGLEEPLRLAHRTASAKTLSSTSASRNARAPLRSPDS
jgi:hypothetical protein